MVLAPVSPPHVTAFSTDTKVETATTRLFLALRTGALEEIAPLLAENAAVRPENSTAPQPALKELQQLSAKWSSSASGGMGERQALGPVDTKEIRHHDKFVLVTVAVAGPPEVQGDWKLRFNRQESGSLIEEIILPQPR
jgi:hypothetical protein